MGDFDFTKKYESAVNEMLEKEITGIKSANLPEEDRALRIRMIDENRKYFERVLNESKHNSAIENGETVVSNLFNGHQDHPIPFFSNNLINLYFSNRIFLFILLF